MKAWWSIVICLFLASSAPVRATDMPTIKPRPGETVANLPSVSVDGEAEERVKPDVALLSLEAVDERPTAAAAAIENARLTQVLLATMQKYGVADSDIHADALDLSPQFRERTDPKSGNVVERIFTGYSASTVYRVQIHKVDDAPRIARQIVESGADIYRGLTFQALDRDERLDALRAKAVQKALQRATRYAETASLRLGDILQIAPLRALTPVSDDQTAIAKGAAGQVALSVPAQASDIVLRAGATVSWELKPKDGSDCAADKASK
jgi:uncharacterized protein YggE